MMREWWLKFKRYWLPYPMAYAAKYLIRLILKTCRIQVQGMESFLETAQKGSCIIMLWHNRLAIISEILYQHAPKFTYAAFISKSRDGEPLAVLAHSYKQGRTIRVSHDARHQALKEMISHLRYGKEIIVITPDGPRGPKYEVKPGMIIAAKEVGSKIIPFTWTADKYWELGTWDGFRLPKPFSKIDVILGSPVRIPPEYSMEEASKWLNAKLKD